MGHVGLLAGATLSSSIETEERKPKDKTEHKITLEKTASAIQL